MSRDLTYSSNLGGPFSLVLTLSIGPRFIAWYPFFRGMPTGPKVFLEPPAVSGLRPMWSCVTLRNHVESCNPIQIQNDSVS